jgi:hypothetical protein
MSLRENHKHLLQFLDDLDAITDHIPAAGLQADEVHGQAVAAYVNGFRVQVDTTQRKLQDSLHDLRISFACVVQAIGGYKASVMQQSCDQRNTWILRFNRIAQDVYNMSMHKPVRGDETITQRFMTLLFVLFGYPDNYLDEDPDNMREIYRNNAEFQKRLKLAAKYMKPLIQEWRRDNAAQLEWRDAYDPQLQLTDKAGAKGTIRVRDLDVDALVQWRDAGDLSTADLLLDFKALCNKL